MVKNDQVISDKVLTYSDGFIESYEETENKKEDGLFHVRISAEVKRLSLVDKLRGAKVTTKNVQGQDIAASAATQLEQRQNAAELISKYLGELPDVLECKARKLTGQDYDEASSTLTLDISVAAKRSKYAAFLKRFTDLMKKVCLQRDSVDFTAKPKITGKTVVFAWSSFPAAGIPIPRGGKTKGRSVQARTLSEPNFEGLPKAWLISVLAEHDTTQTISHWNRYVVDCDPEKALAGLRGKLSVKIELLDSNHETIKQDEFLCKDQDVKDNRISRDRLLQESSGLFLVAQQRRKASSKSDGEFQESSWSLLGLVGMRPRKNGNYTVARSGDDLSITDRRNLGLNKNRVVAIRLTDDETIYGRICPWALGGMGDYRTELTFQRKINISEPDLKRVKEIRCSVVFVAEEATDK